MKDLRHEVRNGTTSIAGQLKRIEKAISEYGERTESSFKLKNLHVLGIQPLLAEIVDFTRAQFGLDTITSAFRAGDSGVHGTSPLRAIDLRCREASLGNMIAAEINHRWIYDPSRPMKVCAICHDTGLGMHLHLQVHPQTRRRI